MTVINTSWMYFPKRLLGNFANHTYNVIDAATEKRAQVWCSTEDFVARYLDVFVDATTQACTLRVSLQSIDLATGYPSGTILGTNNLGYYDLSLASTDDTVIKTGQLGEDVTISKGQYYAIVTEILPFNTGDVVNIGVASIFDRLEIANFYLCGYQNSAWSIGGDTPQPYLRVGIRDTNGASIEYLGFVAFLGSITIKTTDTYNEIGNAIPLTQKVRCIGFWFYSVLLLDTTFTLYKPDNTTVTKSFEKKIMQNTSYGLVTCFWDTPQILTPGTYTLSIKNETSSTQSITGWRFPDAGRMAQIHMGSTCYTRGRLNSGAWTDIPLQRMNMGLICDQYYQRSAPVYNRRVR